MLRYAILLLCLLTGTLILREGRLLCPKKVSAYRITSVSALGHFQPAPRPVAGLGRHPVKRKGLHHKTASQHIIAKSLKAPELALPSVPFMMELKPAAILSEEYRYLFFEEINPPPPRTA